MSADRKYRRLVRLRFLKASDRELSDEFRFHLDMRTAELVRSGLSPHHARAEALRQFGDVDDAWDYCRSEDRRRMREYRFTTWLGNLRRDLLLGLRAMRRHPAFAVTSVVVLAVAIAIATSVYGVVHAYVIRPLPYPDAGRLVHVIAGPSRELFRNAPSLASVNWTALDSVFAATVAWDLDGFTLAGDDRPEYVDGAWVSPGYFTALGMRPAVGRGFTGDEYTTGTPVAIISDALWARRFGRDPGVVGRSIRAHSTDRPAENQRMTIVGVMPADAWHVSRFTDVLRPLSTPRIPSLARLPDGITMAEAERRLNAIILPQLGAVDPAWHMTLVSLQDEYTYQVRPILHALLGASAFLLLIGGASVAGAQVARMSARRAEIQVRVALGASRHRVIMQLLTESVVLAVAAAISGVLLAHLVLGAAGPFVAEQLRADVPGGAQRLAPGGAVLGLAVLLGALIGVGFGMLPAFLSAHIPSAGALRSAAKGIVRGAGSPTLRRTLIAGQVALTMMLLVGAGLMTRSIIALGSAPLGFNAESVVKANLLLPLGRFSDAAARRAGVDRMLATLAATPGVHSAAVVSPHPYRGTIAPSVVTAEGRGSATDGPQAVMYVVSPEYFGVLQIPGITGRTFRPGDADGTPVVIVSEALARRLWPDADPIGRRLRVGADTVWRSVIGTVRETREVVSATQQPDLYVPYAQLPRAFVSVVTRVRSDPASMGPVLQRAVAQVDDVLALADVEPLAAVVDRDGSRHRALAGVLVVFAAFALGLAVLGLYSSLAYVVAQRRQEIAIRVAIGASPRGIARIVLGEGIPVVAAGLLAGTILSFALTRLLATQLYGVTPTDPLTFVAIAAVLALTALVAIAVPIRQAVGVPPAIALRAD
ncbi:MAG TPA: ADOP family duplicated permease [Gemmatimonadaceae bacterium]|nr:ADOP family duplicated permease [Gemmatimonadaceae bacterium]